MSKEAMKLALRSIRELVIDESDDAPALQGVRMRKQAAEKALREALANEALDRMAENARELGLDYGVEQDLRVFARVDAMRAKGLLKLTAALEQPAQQEPVAIVSGYYGGQCVILPTNPARIFNSGTALYTTPPQRNKD